MRLSGRNFEELPTRRLADGTLSSISNVLGLELQVDLTRGEFRFFEPVGNSMLRSYEESEALAKQEAALRREAEAEVERLRAELARLRGEST